MMERGRWAVVVGCAEVLERGSWNLKAGGGGDEEVDDGGDGTGGSADADCCDKWRKETYYACMYLVTVNGRLDPAQ